MNAASPAPRRSRLLLWLPAFAILLLGILFAVGLKRGGESRLIESRWINQPVPSFTLPPATPDLPGVASSTFADGKPRLINVFASWCVPCRVEAPQLEALKQQGVIIEGVAIRDRPEDLARFLNEFGNPYAAIGADVRSEVQIALGSSGVPETFLVDGRGIIRQQIQGVITEEMVPELVAKMRAMQ
jgi:cytochrome c biogenesis protein CcmG/thiol:disulfide interchange protein DsbE